MAQGADRRRRAAAVNCHRREPPARTNGRSLTSALPRLPRGHANGAGQRRLRPMGGGEQAAAGGARGWRGVAAGGRWALARRAAPPCPRRLPCGRGPPPALPCGCGAGGEWGVGGSHPAGRGSRCLRRRRRREGRSLPPARPPRPSPPWRGARAQPPLTAQARLRGGVHGPGAAGGGRSGPKPGSGSSCGSQALSRRGARRSCGPPGLCSCPARAAAVGSRRR